MLYKTFNPVTEVVRLEDDRQMALRHAQELAFKHGRGVVFCLVYRPGVVPLELVGVITVEKAGVGYAYSNEGQTKD
jgi:hypothetical protein